MLGDLNFNAISKSKWLLPIPLTVTLFIIHFIPSYAQSSGNWRTLTVENTNQNQQEGLRSNQITALAESPPDAVYGISGLWIGTDRGLHYYNGRDWFYLTSENDQLPSNQILSLATTREGDLFVGTSRGLCKLERNPRLNAGSSDSIEDICNPLPNTAQFPNGNIQTLALTENDLWVGTPNGVARFNLGTETWQRYTTDQGLPHNDVRQITATMGDALLFATAGGAARTVDGQVWESWTSHNGLISDDLVSVIGDGDGTIWFATNDVGIQRLNPQGEWLSLFKQGIGLATNIVYDLAQDADGQVWVATNAGLHRWNGIYWRQFDAARDKLPSNNILTLLTTSNGTIWSGTDAGLTGLDGTWEGFVQSLTVLQGSIDASGRVGGRINSNSVRALWGDAERIWVGTNLGLNRSGTGGQSWHSYSISDGLINDDISALWGAGQSIWVGTNGWGVSHSTDDGQSWQTFTVTQGLAGGYIQALWGDTQQIWVGTRSGLSHSTDAGQNWQTFTTDDGLPSDIISVLWGNVDEIWVGTTRGLGYSTDAGQSWQTFTTNEGLLDNTITALWGHDEILWLGTEASFQYTVNRGKDWVTPLQEPVRTLWWDGVRLWAMIGDGVLSFSTDMGKTWQAFDMDRGLSTGRVTSLWGIEDHLWIGTSDHGVIRYQPRGPKPWARLSAVLPSIESVEQDETTDESMDNNYPPNAPIRRINVQDLAIQFEGGSLMMPWTDLQYEVQLFGAEDTPRRVALETGGTSTSPYDDLAYGEYTFEMAAINRDGIWSEVKQWPIQLQARPHLSVIELSSEDPNVLSAGEPYHALWGDEETIWAGGDAGLYRSENKGQTWSSELAFTDTAGDGSVTALWGDGTRLWIGTSAGIHALELPNARVQITTFPSIPVQAIIGDGQTIWVGTEKGVSRSSDNGKLWLNSTVEEGLADNQINALWLQNNILWSGTATGLSRSLDGGATWSETYTQTAGLSDDTVTALWGTDHILWVGTSNGLVRSNDQGQSWLKVNCNLTENGALSPNHIHALWGVGTLLWVGYEDRVDLCIEGGNRWQTFTPKSNGLGAGKVNAIWGMPDAKAEAVWMATDNGISVPIDGNDYWTTAEQKIIVSPNGWDDSLEVDVRLSSYDPDSLTDEIEYTFTLQRIDGTQGVTVPVSIVEDGIRRLTITPHDSNERHYNLVIRAKDGDKNLSSPFMIRINPAQIGPSTGPFAWRENVGQFFLLSLIIFVFFLMSYIIVVYLAVVRPTEIPLSVALDPRQLARIVGGGPHSYSQYLLAIGDQSSLGQLLTLTLPPNKKFNLEESRAILGKLAVPARFEDIRNALNLLVRRDVLLQLNGSYTFAVPNLPNIHRRVVGKRRIEHLAQRVREENPVYNDALRFFPAAGFELQDLDPNRFLLFPRKSRFAARYGERFGEIYTQIITDVALSARDVRTVRYYAYRAYEGDIQGRIALVVVNRTPKSDARFQIYAFRAESNFTIIPLSHSLLRQALLDDRAAEALDVQVRLYLGETDLYAFSTPVTDVLSFFGRTTIIDTILTCFDRHQHVGLFGLRKMGKTSLLWQLRDRLNRHAIANIDLQMVARDATLLYPQIIQEWARDIRFKYPDLELPILHTLVKQQRAEEQSEILNIQGWNDSMVEQFRHDLLALHELLQARETEPRFVLLLDEVERMLPAPDDSEQSMYLPGFHGYETFLSMLRGLAQQYDFLRILVASVDPRINRIDRWAQQDNPMYRFFREIFLPPFEKDECDEMVTNIGQQMGIDYTPDALIEIYHETGGHPFLTRSLCSTIIQDRQRPIVVDVDAVEAGVKTYLLQPNSYLDSLWEERLDPTAQELLIRLAEAGTIHRDLLLADREERRHVNNKLGDLTERFLLQQENGVYSIAFKLFQRWICYYLLGLELDKQ